MLQLHVAFGSRWFNLKRSANCDGPMYAKPTLVARIGSRADRPTCHPPRRGNNKGQTNGAIAAWRLRQIKLDAVA
jgi:hypothetical protein